MVVLRIFGALLLITLGVSSVGYASTKDIASSCASPPARF
jgi:hypothetical protein